MAKVTMESASRFAINTLTREKKIKKNANCLKCVQMAEPI